MKKIKIQNIQRFLFDYAILFLSTIFVFLLIRLGEYYYIYNHSDQQLSLQLFFTKSVKYDTLFILITGAILFIPAFLISILHFRTYKITIRIVIFFIIFIQLIFTQFFLTNNAVLTAILFEFTFEELYHIANTEMSGNRSYFWIMNFIIIVFTIILLFIKHKRIKARNFRKNIVVYTTLACFIIAVLSHKNLFKEFQAFDTAYQFLLGNSKPIFFIDSYSKAYGTTNDSEVTKKLAIINFQTHYPQRNFTHKNLPFIYDSEDSNVLGSFFKKDSIQPNIVLIISESLSSTFSGESNCIGGSLTPFTDSLAKAGLNWTHFLSNADRSFGVLPNILASLPFGTSERGFMGQFYANAYGSRYPNQTSIIQYLKENDYLSNYYYGGWKLFDKIEYFIKYNGIDYFTSDNNFDTTKYQKKSNKQSDYVWGYNDRALFSQSLDDMHANKFKSPFFSIYQTITVHSPFNLADDHYYNQDYLKSRLTKCGLELDSINIPHKIISSAIAADDDLRFFIQACSKTPQFKNTIFIIVGDHAINLNLRAHALERFHVPLIIYSPLITKAATFKGMCSHIDIAPSLLSLLAQNFDLSFSPQKHFIGEGLDTSRTYCANRSIPLTINRSDIPSFVFDNYMEYGEQLFTLDADWNTGPVSSAQSELVSKWIETYKIINRMVCNENKLWMYPNGLHHNKYFQEK
ncbi:hypothetical protein DNU06_16340 [Putridiphycobacter roseus]|uniref:Sulfatase N-terminal domain-containing protein n=1 Tax=Putridiphycobacter roseus TaxID=2219161 RepID=A0A2W1N914_9FLAO|nr:LTA synthase family protein [Putridiphycobacter roseus]PZE15745.1 hypothetical protein DNU06_16340 [Putridiphycobacter roseus]